MNSKLQNPGALDPAFGNEGKVIYPDGDGTFNGAAKVMADGRILAIKNFEDGVSLVRFLSDGSIDEGFGDQGIVNTVLRPGVPVADIKWQFQGTANVIVAARLEYRLGAENAIIVVRLLEDGTVDEKFGQSGVAELPILRVENQLIGLSVSRSGIAVTMLQTRALFINSSLIGSLTSEGQLNKKFDGGVVYAPTRSYNYGDILAQTDGKIIVAGVSIANNTLLLARYSLDGTLDTEYGNNGFFEYSDSSASSVNPFGIAFQADGKVTVAGSLSFEGSINAVGLLLRVTTDGAMDDSFNGGKPVLVFVGDNGYENRRVAVQPDGRIVAIGSTLIVTDVALIRVLPDGVMDESFGEAGIVLTDFETGIDIADSISVQGDGKLFMSATSYFFDGRPSPKLSMARFIG
jgi:uncharacterized delta-60 repeat protein